MNKTEAIFSFLADHAPEYLRPRIHPGLEVQYKAVKSVLPPKSGKTASGHSWKMFVAEDGTLYKDVRIPWSADTDPHYTDSEMSWDVEKYADGIGVSGWNWKDKRSEFFYYDFDSVSGHKANALTPEEMDSIIEAVSGIPWVQVQRSKGGDGIHLYVFLGKPEPCQNHIEHAAMSRSVLGLMSALSGKDLHGDIDCYGYLGWIWHKATKTGGYALVKAAVQDLDSVPKDWKRHLEVVGRKKGRKKANTLQDQSDEARKEIERQQHVQLDDEHQRLLTWFAGQGPEVDWTWDPEIWYLQCHTFDLKRAHEELRMTGVFYTLSSGENRPDVNCWAAPLPNGGWQVRRFGKGAGEHPSWHTDASGWTRCDFNVSCPLKLAASLHEGALAPSGQYEFTTLSEAIEALGEMGKTIDRKAVEPFLARKAKLEEDKTAMVLRVDRSPDDVKPKGWTEERFWWCLVLEQKRLVARMEAPDDRVRGVVTNGAFSGYGVFTESAKWETMPDKQAQRVLTHFMGPESESAMNAAVANPWTMENIPFGPEYPGGRVWNRFGAQLAFEPKKGEHPTWDECLRHMGTGLDKAAAEYPWCKKNGIKNGADYLKMWLACLFQKPTIRLPYLFFQSEAQITGKSTLHEALYFLFKDGRGYCRAKDALTSEGGYNGQLSGAILCVMEEHKLGRASKDRMKDWVTGLTIEIRPMFCQARTETNYTHWWHTANYLDALPLDVKDTRVVIIPIPELAAARDKDEMHDEMRKEAPAFLWTLLNLEVPAKENRLGVPPLITEAKRIQMSANQDALQRFLAEETEPCAGGRVSWKEFRSRFMESLTQPKDRGEWDENHIRAAMPHLRGKAGKAGDIHIANIHWIGDGQEPSAPYVSVVEGRLMK